jgi:hypothetical protein
MHANYDPSATSAPKVKKGHKKAKPAEADDSPTDETTTDDGSTD